LSKGTCKVVSILSITSEEAQGKENDTSQRRGGCSRRDKGRRGMKFEKGEIRLREGGDQKRLSSWFIKKGDFWAVGRAFQDKACKGGGRAEGRDGLNEWRGMGWNRGARKVDEGENGLRTRWRLFVEVGRRKERTGGESAARDKG